jgi:cellulose synthase/poly-beta-1,6-N-acetylglucosamine synthase-like glycosyltransferase
LALSTALPLADPLLAASVILSLAFFVYAINGLHLTIRAKHYKPLASSPLSNRPTVAIHLPIYNEFYVVGRLLDSCVRMAEAYGKEAVRIYVVDDSNDETCAEIDKLASHYAARGFKLSVLRRVSRAGFKAGGLQTALEATDEKYIAVLDADFAPPTDFLVKTIAYMEEDPSRGFVQSKWGYFNRNYNLVTRSIAVALDAHFLIEQQGRNGSAYLMNFNGSAGVLRTKAIRDAGGWASDTLTEDLDLSYRMQLVGYRGVYLGNLEVPGELPPTITGLKRQQGRWARGSVQTAKKLLRRISRSDRLTRGQKIEAGIHLTSYLIHPLMVISFLLVVLAAFLPVDVVHHQVGISIPTFPSGQAAGKVMYLSLQIAPWVIYSALILMSTLAVLYYCLEAVRGQDLSLIGKLKQITLLVVLGYGISISNSTQALKGLLSSDIGPFLRTPKYAITKAGQTWGEKKYQLRFNFTTFLEVCAVAIAVLAIARTLFVGNIGLLPILSIYLIGYAFVLFLTIKQTIGSTGRTDA